MITSDDIHYCPYCTWNLTPYGYIIGNNGPVLSWYCQWCGWVK